MKQYWKISLKKWTANHATNACIQLLGKVMQKIECFRSDTGIFTSNLYYISMFIFLKHIFIKNICSKFLILCPWCWRQGWTTFCRRKILKRLNDQKLSRMTKTEIFHEVKLLQICATKFSKTMNFQFNGTHNLSQNVDTMSLRRKILNVHCKEYFECAKFRRMLKIMKLSLCNCH